MITNNPEVIELINKIEKFSSGPAESVYIRCQEAIRRLGEIGDPAAVEPLIAVMYKYQESDRTGRIKLSCSLALMKIGDLGGIKAVLKDGDHTAVLNWVRDLIGLKTDGKETMLNLDDIQATIPDELIEPLIEYLSGSWLIDYQKFFIKWTYNEGNFMLTWNSDI